ncbi:MAG: hypothetical protein K0Q49_2511 [Haloplasmataceae bacterium]|jgi:hypothetical protein|nr:hypothetical protein [Haloplasmataceae bacterium]
MIITFAQFTFIPKSTEGGKRDRGTEQAAVSRSLNKKGHPKYVKMEVIENVYFSLFRKVNHWTKIKIHSDGYRS